MNAASCLHYFSQSPAHMILLVVKVSQQPVTHQVHLRDYEIQTKGASYYQFLTLSSRAPSAGEAHVTGDTIFDHSNYSELKTFKK